METALWKETLDHVQAVFLVRFSFQVRSPDMDFSFLQQFHGPGAGATHGYDFDILVAEQVAGQGWNGWVAACKQQPVFRYCFIPECSDYGGAGFIRADDDGIRIRYFAMKRGGGNTDFTVSHQAKLQGLVLQVRNGRIVDQFYG